MRVCERVCVGALRVYVRVCMYVRGIVYGQKPHPVCSNNYGSEIELIVAMKSACPFADSSQAGIGFQRNILLQTPPEGSKTQNVDCAFRVMIPLTVKSLRKNPIKLY